MAEDHVHHYRVRTSWTGSTDVGYEAYDRTRLTTIVLRDRRLGTGGMQDWRQQPDALRSLDRHRGFVRLPLLHSVVRSKMTDGSGQI